MRDSNIVLANTTTVLPGIEEEEGFSPVRVRPLWLVGTLGFLTAPFFGLYTLLWLGMTWYEIKRATGVDTMHPWWHALTPLVPFYSLFCFYSHFQTIQTVAAASGSTITLHPQLALVGWMLASLFLVLSNGTPGAESLYPIGMAIGAAVLMYGQMGLNAYARALADGPLRLRAHWLEWVLVPILIPLNALILLDTPIPGAWVAAATVTAWLFFGVSLVHTLRHPLLAPDQGAWARRPRPTVSAAVAAMTEPSRPVETRGYRVAITAVPASLEAVVGVLCDFDSSLTEGEAREVLATIPVVIADDLTLKDAVVAQQQLRAAGATVEVR